MRAYNVCPTRYVRAEHPEEVAASLLPGVVVAEHEIAPGKIVRLATPSDPTAGKPIFTIILEKLLKERADVRAQIKKTSDPDIKSILDKRQLSCKVSCNSAYGLLGATKGYLSLPDLAAVTTYRGRTSLQFSQHTAETVFGARTIAGDTGTF
jgi:DNA polymerase elongation subunit (family B)